MNAHTEKSPSYVAVDANGVIRHTSTSLSVVQSFARIMGKLEGTAFTVGIVAEEN